VEVAGELTQKASRVISSHYIGTGKIEELKALLEQHEANIAIFNDELSPSQIRNLEASLQCKVIDRTILILDIFAERARTREAQLQVEVAELQYMLPRLIGLRESLGRQSGGVGTKNKGAGEKKLELDRRRIEEKITALNKELETLVSGRQIQRKQRHKNKVPVVGLVGYTNAGKSSMMNALMETYNPTSHKQVLAKDMLFATLETSVRSIRLPDNKSFLLTDTVGFVRNLPHHLIKAFRSTLEEVAESDLLVHVVDYSNPEYEQLIAVTNQTLKELGADHIPVVYAYNKTELTGSEWPENEQDIVYVSARQKVGIDELVARIRERIFDDYIQCELLIPFDQGRLISYFNENAHIMSTSYEENGTKLTLECKRADYEKYKDDVIRL
jgi:GTP-binding protein HflX